MCNFLNFTHDYTQFYTQEKGFQYMLKAAQSKKSDYISAGAQYNIGRAYFQVAFKYTYMYSGTSLIQTSLKQKC